MQLILTEEVAETIATQLVSELKPSFSKLLMEQLRPDKLMNKTQLCEWLEVSPKFLNQFIEAKGFPRSINGRYSQKAIEKWIETRSRA